MFLIILLFRGVDKIAFFIETCVRSCPWIMKSAELYPLLRALGELMGKLIVNAHGERDHETQILTFSKIQELCGDLSGSEAHIRFFAFRKILSRHDAHPSQPRGLIDPEEFLAECCFGHAMGISVSTQIVTEKIDTSEKYYLGDITLSIFDIGDTDEDDDNIGGGDEDGDMGDVEDEDDEEATAYRGLAINNFLPKELLRTLQKILAQSSQ